MLLDCKGDICPVPVIKTKKALMGKTRENFSGLEITVDNRIAVQNISKYLTAQRCEFYVTSSIDEEEYFTIHVHRVAGTAPGETISYMVAISSNIMGSGDDTLGKQLLKGFVFALTQAENLPAAVVFYNSGVQLCLESADTVEDLRNLLDNGVQILSCGLCLNHYNAVEKLAVGEVTDMYSIVNLMQQYKVVRP